MSLKEIIKISLNSDLKNYNCAGIVLFNNTFTEIVLVETDHGHFSFPKGKREKKESLLETAIRETFEETGIESKQYLLSDFVLAEFAKPDSKTPSVLYFIGQLQSKLYNDEFKFDTKELKNVKWISHEDALKIDDFNFKVQRKNVLARAVTEIKDSNFKLYSTIDLENTLKPRTSVIPKKKELSEEEQEVKRLEGFSKLLSWILRHGINEMGLQMDTEGYVSVDSLLKLEKLVNLSLEDLVKVVNTNKKQRFKLITKDDHKQYIRANQGHSSNIGNLLDDNIMMKKITLDDNILVGYHGTSLESWELIKTSGLKPCERKHCHLSRSYMKDSQTVISGIREHSQVIIKVDIKKALESGVEFYLSDNDVILSSFISVEFLVRIK
jgi:2'-phosphotransferase